MFNFFTNVLRRFSDIANKQEEKGIKKYGHPLDPFDTKWDWLEMAEEELVDGFKYLEAEKERRDTFLEELGLLLNKASLRNEHVPIEEVRTLVRVYYPKQR